MLCGQHQFTFEQSGKYLDEIGAALDFSDKSLLILWKSRAVVGNLIRQLTTDNRPLFILEIFPSLWLSAVLS